MLSVFFLSSPLHIFTCLFSPKSSLQLGPCFVAEFSLSPNVQSNLSSNPCCVPVFLQCYKETHVVVCGTRNRYGTVTTSSTRPGWEIAAAAILRRGRCGAQRRAICGFVRSTAGFWGEGGTCSGARRSSGCKLVGGASVAGAAVLAASAATDVDD